MNPEQTPTPISTPEAPAAPAPAPAPAPAEPQPVVGSPFGSNGATGGSKKSSTGLIIGIIVGAVAIIAAILIVVFAVIIPNANKDNGGSSNGGSSNTSGGGNGGGTVDPIPTVDPVVGKYEAYAYVNLDGTENAESVKQAKDDYGIVITVEFKKDGTGVLARQVGGSTSVSRNFTWKDGTISVKADSNGSAAEGTYKSLNNGQYVTITDDANSTIKFVRTN